MKKPIDVMYGEQGGQGVDYFCWFPFLENYCRCMGVQVKNNEGEGCLFVE